MRISYDDQLLFSVSQDGSLLALRVTDKDGRGLKREKDIAFAEEVLVMKSDLEEKVCSVDNHCTIMSCVRVNCFLGGCMYVYQYLYCLCYSLAKQY